MEVGPLMIFYVNNYGALEVSEKGIYKAMIQELSKLNKRDVCSSSRLPSYWQFNGEGRTEEASDIWDQWENKDPNIEYQRNKDRYIYKFKI